MALVYKATHYGLPDDQIAAYDAVLQAAVHALFERANRMWDQLQAQPKKTGEFHSTTMKASQYTHPHTKPKGKRLMVTCHNAGWWAVLQWAHPYPDTSPERVDFWVYGAQGSPKRIDWDKFQHNAGVGKADLYLQAVSGNGKWHTPGSYHTIDLKHPLLFQLRMAELEIEEAVAGA